MLKKLLITVIVLGIVAMAATTFVIWRYPLAVFAWMNRRALVKDGLARHTVTAPAGPQVIFEGGNGPTLILLHGAGDQAGTWSKVAPRLTANYHVVALDLPGHGDSAPAAGPLKMETLAGSTEAVLAHYSPPLTLVGNSLGAWIAMLYARQHPERVARVVAVDGGPLRGDRPALTKLPANREEARRMIEATMDPGSARVPDFVVDDVVRQANRGPMARIVQAGGDLEKSLFDNLRDFSVPVDLVWGESDQLVPLEYARKMEAQLPAVRLTTLPRCGHMPQQECPVAFSNTLQMLLRQPAPSPKPSIPAEMGK